MVSNYEKLRAHIKANPNIIVYRSAEECSQSLLELTFIESEEIFPLLRQSIIQCIKCANDFYVINFALNEKERRLVFSDCYNSMDPMLVDSYSFFQIIYFLPDDLKNKLYVNFNAKLQRVRSSPKVAVNFNSPTCLPISL